MLAHRVSPLGGQEYKDRASEDESVQQAFTSWFQSFGYCFWKLLHKLG